MPYLCAFCCSEIAIKDAKRINHFMPRPAFLKLLLEEGLEQVGWL